MQPKSTKTAEELASEERWERYRRMALTPEQVAEENCEMASLETEEAWTRYFANQLSDSERTESRARMLTDLQRAKEEGVFREIEKLRGKIKWSISLGALREDRD